MNTEIINIVISIIGYPPKIVSTSPSNVTVKENESILLTCSAISASPISYKWLKKGENLPSHCKYYYIIIIIFFLAKLFWTDRIQ